VEEQKQKYVKGGKGKVNRSITIPMSLSSKVQLEDLIHRLEMLREELSNYEEFELKIDRE
jgi:hypothetical protein